MTLTNFLRKLIIASILLLSPTIGLSQSANDGFRVAKEKELKMLETSRKNKIERNIPTTSTDKRIAKLRKELAELDSAKNQVKVTLRRQLASYQKIRKNLAKDGKSTEKVDEKIKEIQAQIEKPDDEVKPRKGLVHRIRNEKYAKGPKRLRSKIIQLKKYIAARSTQKNKAPQSVIDRLAELEAHLLKSRNQF
jgi:chromosome segregation ATPase